MSRGSSSKLARVRQLRESKRVRSGEHNFNFHDRLGEPSPKPMRANSGRRRPATAGLHRRGVGVSSHNSQNNQALSNTRVSPHGSLKGNDLKGSKSMPSLAKIPGDVRHSVIKGLAASRPHDRNFHSRLIQLEVEFNERVRYLPLPSDAETDPSSSGAGPSSDVLGDVGTSSSRYIAFEEQFEEIISHDTLFCHLLRRVKTEYDRQVRELTRVVYSRKSKQMHMRLSEAAHVQQKRLEKENLSLVHVIDASPAEMSSDEKRNTPSGISKDEKFKEPPGDDVFKMLENQNARMRLQIESQQKNVLEAQNEVDELKAQLSEKNEKIDNLEADALAWRKWVEQSRKRALEGAGDKSRPDKQEMVNDKAMSSFEYKDDGDSLAESKAEAAAAELDHLREEVRLLRAALEEEQAVSRNAGLMTGSSVLWDDDEDEPPSMSNTSTSRNGQVHGNDSSGLKEDGVASHSDGGVATKSAATVSGVRGTPSSDKPSGKMSRRFPPSMSYSPAPRVPQTSEVCEAAGALASSGDDSSALIKPISAAVVATKKNSSSGREGGDRFDLLSSKNLMLMEIPEGDETLASPATSLSSNRGAASKGNGNLPRSTRSLSYGGFNTGRSLGGRSVLSMSELSDASQMSIADALHMDDLSKREFVPSLEL